MTYKTDTTPPSNILPQALFLATTLAIIVGGLWTLYMGDAPYHPEISATEAEIVLASDQTVLVNH